LDLLLKILAGYAVAGGAIGAAFVTFGIGRVLPYVSVTPGGRLILLPGIVALWPLVLGRWLNFRRRR
jgi:hypothetical protein